MRLARTVLWGTLLVAMLAGCGPGRASRPAGPTPAGAPAATITPEAPPAAPPATNKPVAVATATSPPATPPPGASPTLTVTAVAGAIPAGQWVRRAYMPTLRSELAAAVLGGLIYTAGGFVEGRAGLESSPAFEVFDPAANVWATRTALPAPLNHPQLAAWGDFIYVFGGWPGCPGCQPDGATWRYDPATDAWSARAAMPDWRAGGAAVALGDFIYLVGGEGGQVRSGAVSTLLRYDPVADSWAGLAPLPQPRDHVAAVTFGGKLYAFGGRWGQDLRSMVIYDPATDTWAPGQPMRDARAGLAAAAVGDRIYVAGGELVSGPAPQIVTSVEVYDPAANTWVERFELPIGLHGLPGASVEGVLYVLGGSTLPGDVSNNGAVWAYRP